MMTMNGFCKVAMRLGALAVCGAALSTMPLLAQGGGPRGMMSPEAQQAMLDDMTKKVDLTDDQVTKIKAINADQMKQMMTLREAGGDPQEMRPKMMAIRTEAQSKIKALLTDEQKPKYDVFMASQRPMGGGRGPGDGGAPPPPPQN